MRIGGNDINVLGNTFEHVNQRLSGAKYGYERLLQDSMRSMTKLIVISNQHGGSNKTTRRLVSVEYHPF